jgi:cbb3-type cytochrome oxidase cytochrome c subunit
LWFGDKDALHSFFGANCKTVQPSTVLRDFRMPSYPFESQKQQDQQDIKPNSCVLQSSEAHAASWLQ